MTSPAKALIPVPSTYVTGHCSTGNHEGVPNKAKSGAMHPTCKGLYVYRYVQITCMCWCHEMFAAARASAPVPVGDPILPMGSTYTPRSDDMVPQDDASTRPDPSIGDESSFWHVVVKNPDLEIQLKRIVYNLVLKTPPPAWEPVEAPDGRRTKGSLDINVEVVCLLKLQGYIPQDLTPLEIGQMINFIAPPSSGAIQAVFNRWENLGFCVLGTKPVRLISFTNSVGEHGISGAKKVSKREKEARMRGFA